MLGVVPLATALAFVVASVVSATQNASAMTWYAAWHATDFPLSKMSWKKYDQVFYAFALVPFLCFPLLVAKKWCRITTPDVNVLELQAADLVLLPQFVSAAHQNVRSTFLIN